MKDMGVEERLLEDRRPESAQIWLEVGRGWALSLLWEGSEIWAVRARGWEPGHLGSTCTPPLSMMPTSAASFLRWWASVSSMSMLVTGLDQSLGLCSAAVSLLDFHPQRAPRDS